MLPFIFISDVNEIEMKSGEFRTRNYTEDEKERLSMWLESFDFFAYTSTPAFDFITGEKIAEYDNMSTDGKWCWDVETVYHFKKYNLSLSDEFIEDVMNGRL